MAEQADEPRESAGGEADEPVQRESVTRRRGLAVSAAVLALLIGANAWAGWREVQARRADQAREQMVAAGRAALQALTTIDYTDVDGAVQRILDASTGAFHDDFAQRAESFKAAARKAQSMSVGNLGAAGVESFDGDSGQVLVALTVMTSNRGEPEKRPKSWRTRVTVTKTADGFKVAEVEFVR